MVVDSSINEPKITTVTGPAMITLAIDRLGTAITKVIPSDEAALFDKTTWLEEVRSFARAASSVGADPLYITVYIPEGVTIQVVENGNPDAGPADGTIVTGYTAIGFIFDPPRDTEIRLQVLVAPPGSSLTIATALIVGGNIVGSGIATVPIS